MSYTEDRFDSILNPISNVLRQSNTYKSNIYIMYFNEILAKEKVPCRTAMDMFVYFQYKLMEKGVFTNIPWYWGLDCKPLIPIDLFISRYKFIGWMCSKKEFDECGSDELCDFPYIGMDKPFMYSDLITNPDCCRRCNLP